MQPGGPLLHGVAKVHEDLIHPVDPDESDARVLQVVNSIPHRQVVSYGPVRAACITGGDTTQGVNFYDLKADPGNFETSRPTRPGDKGFLAPTRGGSAHKFGHEASAAALDRLIEVLTRLDENL